MFTALASNGDNMPYLTRVLSYDPSPGQFINEYPPCAAGDDYATVLKRAENILSGGIEVEEVELPDGTLISDTTLYYNKGLVCLGGYGGSVTVAFDHPVINVAGAPDFEIFGNAFVADGTDAGGSSEPGIVLVSVDVNGNGLADDPWYELAGSERFKSTTQQNFTITYYKPAPDKPVVGATRQIIDKEHIKWESNDDDPDRRLGYYARLQVHNHSYWPLWLPDDSTVMVRTGERLPRNFEAYGTMTIQRFFDYGYVDNKPSRVLASVGDDYNTGVYSDGLDIDWAIDDSGQHVYLPYIDFIKVYTGINQYSSSLGETSTEVAGGVDFHPNAVLEWQPGDVNGDRSVNVADVNAVLSMMLEERGVPATADINHDGFINVADVNLILSIILEGA